MPPQRLQALQAACTLVKWQAGHMVTQHHARSMPGAAAAGSTQPRQGCVSQVNPSLHSPCILYSTLLLYRHWWPSCVMYNHWCPVQVAHTLRSSWQTVTCSAGRSQAHGPAVPALPSTRSLTTGVQLTSQEQSIYRHGVTSVTSHRPTHHTGVLASQGRNRKGLGWQLVQGLHWAGARTVQGLGPRPEALHLHTLCRVRVWVHRRWRCADHP
jgi:hypothetical protein